MTRECITSRRHHRNIVVAIVLSLGFLALTGCSQADQTDQSSADPSVASVPRAAASTTPRETVNQDQRPLIRFDSTDEETDAYQEAWLKCLTAHGVPKGIEGKRIAREINSANPTKYDAARKACLGKQPEEYKDRLARTDHVRYLDLARQLQKCVQEAGIKISHDPKDDPIVFSFTDDRQVGRGLDVSRECEKKIFAAK